MKKKSVLFCLLAVLAAGFSVFLLVRGSQGSGAFRGSFVKNSDSYLLNAERMTGTDTHTLALQKGDVLQIHFAVGKGSLKLTIAAPDSTELYAGNGTEAEDFTVNIPADGVYTISVEGQQAAGTLHIQRTAELIFQTSSVFGWYSRFHDGERLFFAEKRICKRRIVLYNGRRKVRSSPCCSVLLSMAPPFSPVLP